MAAAIAIVAALLLAVPAVASAANTYVDGATGSDSNDCTVPSTPCQTIGAALAQSGPNDTTFVADGTYNESVTLSDDKSLVSLDVTLLNPIIDNGSDPNAAITVDGGGAGTISGFTIRSESRPMDVGGGADIQDNHFDASNPSDGFDIRLQTAGSVTIDDNVFVDPDASGAQIGIEIEGAPSPVISGNTFTDLSAGVIAISGDPRISDSQFSGARPLPPDPGIGDIPAAGVIVVGGTPTIVGNTFGAPAQGPSAAVFVKKLPFPGADPIGATLSRNRISGSDVGVQVLDTDLPVTLSNDLIYGNTTGVESTDTSADSPQSTQGDVSATNETIFDNAVDASVSYTMLTLDSSIVGTPIDVVGGNGACTITYSRGSSAASSNGCGNFSTNADPQFVDAASGNYQLQSTSPLIDIGDPASPGPGAVDFYGGPRELLGKQCSTLRRDIGAAEYDPGTTPGCPPPPSPPAPTPTPTPEPPAAPKINKQPDKRSDDTSPTFKFSSNVPGSTFRCKLDHGPYKACSSPKTYHGLEVGKHIFRVYAIDPSGNKGDPRVIRFTVTK